MSKQTVVSRIKQPTAKFGDVVVRIPRVALITNVSEGQRGMLGALHLRKRPWPPDSDPTNMVPEGRYVDIWLYRSDRQPGHLQEDRFNVLDDQENWGDTGLRRLVYELGPTMGAGFGTKVFVTEDGQMKAFCSQGGSAATYACYREHSDKRYPENLHICYAQTIQEIIDSDEPLDDRCEARRNFAGGLTLIYEFSELQILDWHDIDDYAGSLIESWIIHPAKPANADSANE